MRIWTRLLSVGLMAAGACSGEASANCIPNKTLTSWGAQGYFYVNLPPGNDSGTVVGRFWQTGNRALANEGTFDDSQWLRFYEPTGKWYILGELGTAGVVGCPSGNMTVVLDTTTAHNLTIQIDETIGVFDLSRFLDDLDLAPKARPKVLSSARMGSDIVLRFALDPPGGGIYGLPTPPPVQWRLVSASGPVDPGPWASAYTQGPAIAPGTPVDLTLSCVDPDGDRWFASQSIVDGVSSDTVSTRTQLMCGFLAEPGGKPMSGPRPPVPRRDR